jgi:3-hydroxymyristoyl/3-hydroxydecanoyl-(acyl carrier protein) dehydratase
MKFRLVDRIESWTPYQRIRGVKAVSFEEYQLKEAFGDPPRLPELLILESFLQLGNWLILLSSDFRQMGLVIRLAKVCFHEAVLPGQQLRMEINLARHRADGFDLSGEGRVNRRLVISGIHCLAVPVPAQTYVNPDDLRMLFSEIYSGTPPARSPEGGSTPVPPGGSSA